MNTFDRVVGWLGWMANAPRWYTVKKGDTLSAIAQSYYGDASKYRTIFDANRDVLSDPDRIKEGVELRIPWK